MNIMELQKFKRKKLKDLLATDIENLQNTLSEQELFFLISQKLRGGTGKIYKNFEQKLPSGNYQELEVNDSKDSRRIIIDMDNFILYATRDHYKTISYAENPLWANK